MHRESILKKLNNYSPEFKAEKEFRALFLDFINNNTDCFERTLAIGHITGSAWIINAEGNKALMMHHAKLDKWLQPGGHADGDPDIVAVALKEAQEESGLKSIKLKNEDIFDIDIHTIPARKNEAEHLHYDVRFLFEADEKEPLLINSESKALKWVPIEEVKNYSDSESVLRLVEKTL